MAFPIMDPFEAHLRKEFDDADTITFVRAGKAQANAKERIDEIGAQLCDLIRLQNESRKQLAELWRRYLIDCKALGVEPRARPV